MSDAVRDGHERVWRVLAGPATEVAGAVVALPEGLRIAVLRSVLAAIPHRNGVADLEREAPVRRASLVFVETLLRALEMHAERGERAMQSLAGDWLARGNGWARRWRWLAVRTLVRARLLAAPDHDEYQKGLWTLGGSVVDLPAELRGDPELLGEPLWRLFTLEGDRERSFANVDKYAGGEGGRWLETLVELTRAGDVDRQRLLREALAALQRDFPAYRATWFARLYDALEPTAAERGAHLGEYVRLVASRVPQVQAFGVRALAAAAKAGTELPFAQLDELEPAWTARQKGVVAAALQLAANMARAEGPARLPRIAGAMAKALGHASGDVQLRAWQELQRLALPAEPWREVVAPFAAGLSPRVAKLAAPVLGGDAAPALPPLRAAAAAAAQPGAQVEPIASFDELVRELTALVAGAGDPLVLERCLDGVVRLAGERPADFERRTAGLRKVARRDEPRRFQPFVRAWLDGRDLGEKEGLLESAWRHADVVAPLQPRLREALRLARASRGLPLLALPTHAPFWIDGDELVRRLDAWTNANARPAEHDLAQALRRVPTAQRAAVHRKLPAASRRAADAAFDAPPQIALAPAMRWEQSRDGTRWRRRDVGLGDVAAAPAHPVAQFVADVHPASPRRLWAPNESETPLLLRSLAGLAPNDVELLCALAAPRLGVNADGGTVARGDVAFLEPLLWPSTAPGPNAHVLLAIALGARAPEMCGLAIDVVLAMLADGRLRVDDLGAALRTLLSIRFVAGARWAKSLRTIADAGDAATVAVFALLDGMLAGPADDAARELGELLSLGVDLAAATGRSITSPDAVQLLRAIAAGSGGKAATLARELLPAGGVLETRTRTPVRRPRGAAR